MRTIVHLSDLHFGRTDPAVIEPLLARLREIGPQLVAVSGDLTQRARASQFDDARAFLDRDAFWDGAEQLPMTAREIRGRSMIDPRASRDLDRYNDGIWKEKLGDSAVIRSSTDLAYYFQPPEELGASEVELAAEVDRHLDHERKLASYRGPLLVLHAIEDDLVDAGNAVLMTSWAASEDKELVLLPRGGHNSVVAENEAAYFRALREFLGRVSANGARRP